jgi:hypothetical protein
MVGERVRFLVNITDFDNDRPFGIEGRWGKVLEVVENGLVVKAADDGPGFFVAHGEYVLDPFVPKVS